MATKSAATKASEAQAEFYKELTEKARIERLQLLRQEARYAASQDAHRIFNFEFAVNKASVSETMTYLGQWYREDPTRPIKIVFNSPGGSVIDGLALYDYIKLLRDEGAAIDTVGNGMVASMAGPLLQAGEVRTLGRNACFLIHEISSGAIGKISEIEDEAKFVKVLNDRLFGLLAERSNLTARQIKSRAKRKDWWFMAEEALELGFCDNIE